MSKRVYEVARELGLSTNEVIRRLNDAGVEVKSHLAVVEDPIYDKVFNDDSAGHGSGGTLTNGRLEAHEAETLPYSIRSPRNRSLARKVWVYVLIAVLALALAAGVGALSALMLGGELSLPGREESRTPDEQGNAPRPQENDAAERELAADQQNEAEYLARVGDIQADSVQTFLDSHDKLLHYDALTADDI